jgi:hypothetical protein
MKFKLKNLTSPISNFLNKNQTIRKFRGVDEENNAESTEASKKINYYYHLMPFHELAHKFQTSLETGLSNEAARTLLTQNGRNVLTPQKKSLIKQIFGYLLTGFCGILWIGALICILAWKPIGTKKIY